MTAPPLLNWPDAELRTGMLQYINKSSMNHSAWRYTRLDTIHDELHTIPTLEQAELPIVSSYINGDRWYLLTTRSVWNGRAGHITCTPGPDVATAVFENFKAYGQQGVGRMVLQLRGGGEVHLDCETGSASMAPIHYMRYWTIKFPALFKGLESP